jgi:hypothetical protein
MIEVSLITCSECTNIGSYKYSQIEFVIRNRNPYEEDLSIDAMDVDEVFDVKEEVLMSFIVPFILKFYLFTDRRTK